MVVTVCEYTRCPLLDAVCSKFEPRVLVFTARLLALRFGVVVRLELEGFLLVAVTLEFDAGFEMVVLVLVGLLLVAVRLELGLLFDPDVTDNACVVPVVLVRMP